jgi:hypothetical protein
LIAINNEVAGILEADEAPVEKVVDAGCQQQTIFSIQTLVVRRMPLGLAVPGDEVNRVLDCRDPASPLDLHHALLEQVLPAPGPDDRVPICVSD